MIDEKFIRERISDLREKKGVSEYKMSLDLGHSKGYIQSISSGRAMPSMSEFLAICEYLEISPKSFFDERIKYPDLVQKIQDASLKMNEDNLNVILPLMEQLGK